MNKKIIYFSIGILILIGVFFLFNNGIVGNVVGNSDEIKIPISEISGNAKWYEYNSDGVIINYFVVRASDGTIKTAFDACDVCYRNKKGYSQSGEFMVCNNCGNRYKITSLGTENKAGGGCWPGYISSEIEGDNLIIKIPELEKGKYRFK